MESSISPEPQFSVPDSSSRPENRFGPDLLRRLTTSIVGRRRELEAVVASLAAGRHLLLEGPPGTGKSTLLRSVSEQTGSGFEFVEGNAELTPARLIGAFDPAAVLNEGYVAESFTDGPLLRAMRDGSLLYMEEINRIPEETLNVLITVMSESEVTVPRVGRVAAAEGFRLVAAMNPFDAIGTARIASAVYDRCCRLAMGYQSAEEEIEIVAASLGGPSPWVRTGGGLAGVVAMVRDSRSHPDVRTGSSVRGAIDFVAVSGPLAELRGEDPLSAAVTFDAAQLALSGRIRVREGASRTAEQIVEELWERHLRPLDPSTAGDESPSAANNTSDSGSSGDVSGGPGKV